MTLNNRTDFNNFKVLLLIDILSIQDVNSIYGYKNGKSIIHQTNKLLENKLLYSIDDYLTSINLSNTFMKFTNPHTDLFALKIYRKLNDRVILKIKDLILSTIRYHRFEMKGFDVSICIDVTIGCSQSNDKNLLTYAQKALSDAKNNYTNYSYFDPIFFENELVNLKIFNTIKNSIHSSRVEPYFQKIVHAKTKNPYKYEALMRLVSDNGTILSPNVFLEKAKKYRLYPQLMHMMITKVFSYVKQHKVNVSINLDYYDLIDTRMQQYILSSLNNDKIGQYITIEILESEKIQNFDLINQFIRELKEYNVSIAIDDFGSGFSNYENILELDIDYIKIDGSLIQRINEEIYYNLIKSIVSFCKEQQIGVIAEFVSDVSIYRYIKSLDICFVQGYYFGKPVSIKEITNE
ncbi:MAG: EAL domain-containing protein [Campylobacterota bacterium]|nr:EAL domain-containing protein [Campylobacterota bacterium]